MSVVVARLPIVSSTVNGMRSMPTFVVPPGMMLPENSDLNLPSGPRSGGAGDELPTVLLINWTLATLSDTSAPCSEIVRIDVSPGICGSIRLWMSGVSPYGDGDSVEQMRCE